MGLSTYDRKLEKAEVVPHAVVPQHKMIYAQYARTPMTDLTQTAVAPIKLDEQFDADYCKYLEANAVEQMQQEFEEPFDVDEHYRKWCKEWEDYLTNARKGSDSITRGRGKLPRRQQCAISVSRPHTLKMVARLANYVNLIDEMHTMLALQQPIPQEKWTMLIRNSTKRYGTPQLGAPQLQSNEVA